MHSTAFDDLFMIHELFPLLMLGAAALFAGFIDAVVGGGGLIQVPALFSLYPDTVPASLFGTNKISSFVGTSNSAIRYVRSVRMPWRAALPAAAAAFIFAYLGSMSVAWLPVYLLRPMILALLIGAAIYTFWRKEFGTTHRPRHRGRHELVRALLIGAVIGFYDGFFGPGAGSFLIFLFIRVFGFDFLHASAAAKIVNVATNLASIGFFIPHGYYLPLAAVIMAAANLAGSFIGTRMALRRGSGFVRRLFLGVVCVLIVKFAWDTFA